MRHCPYRIAQLLPHRAPMILLDELIAYDATSAQAVTTIRPTSLFVEQNAIPAYVGLEYMAQTCGAHAGALARDGGEPVRIGLLLGTRRYRAHVSGFHVGARLTVLVSAAYRDNEMGAFDCRIEIEGNPAAEAQLTVYQPTGEQIAAWSGG